MSPLRSNRVLALTLTAVAIAAGCAEEQTTQQGTESAWTTSGAGEYTFDLADAGPQEPTASPKLSPNTCECLADADCAHVASCRQYSPTSACFAGTAVPGPAVVRVTDKLLIAG